MTTATSRIGLGIGIAALLVSAGCRLETRSPSLDTEARAPDCKLTNHDGSEVQLAPLLSRGPVLVVFYRGYW